MAWTSTSCKQLLSALFALASFIFSFAQNPIVAENALPGTPFSEWSVPDFKDNRIAGFATKMSVNSGETVRFKINVQEGSPYTIKIYRIGYYAGNGARLVSDLGLFMGTVQPAPITNTTTGLVDCGNWSESAHWGIPASAISGLYIAKLVRTGGGSNHIVFIVRNDNYASDLFLQFPDTRWQAYNGYGGNSLYDGTTEFPFGHAVKVSYNRPFFIYNAGFNGNDKGEDWYMNCEYPMIRWLERNGYNITYTSGGDVASSSAQLLIHKVFISIGHDEYWSKEQRENVEAARNAGVHLAFFSGNEVYWKTRWEDNFRTLVCYKEGFLGGGQAGERVCGYKCDTSSGIWTGLWRTGGDYDAGKPENALTGQISWEETPGAIKVPALYKKLRFWRNTTIPNLTTGQTATLAPNTLGHEWDWEQYPDSYPSGRITMSSTTLNGHTHKLSLYRHSSGALVFGAGTVQWSWGLDGEHYNGTPEISQDMQQATVNLFADMNVQPATMQANLIPATKSTDVTAPVSAILSPSSGVSVLPGSTVTITGNAADGGGGVVAGVEISLDGGVTWHAANISAIDANVTWSYSWVTSASGTFNIKSRGFDDSGNKENPGTGINITVGNTICPCTIFQLTDVPADTRNDGQPIEVGIKFRASQNGYITGIRFYKGSGTTTGTHIGHLWSSTGTKLAEATFINESDSGWQQVSLANPVAITAGTTYVVSYFSSSGDYVTTNPFFTQAVVNGPLRALAYGEDGPNGVYIYSATSAFPTNNFETSNYWADVVFNPSINPACPCTIFQPTNVAAVPLVNDGQSIEVGVKFRTTQNGYITGIRFYKGAGTTGTHVGHLWSITGTKLAEATFTNETASGWQQVSLANPVAITAGTTYVASYFSSSGDYAKTNPFFTQAVVNGPLRALASGEDGPNGVYIYSATSAFPTNNFETTNYWADVVFNTSAGPGTIPPAITIHPASQTICTGNNVSFTSAASGTPAPTIQWQVSTNGTTWTNINGATASTLTFTTTTGDNNKQYRAVWTNSGGLVNSNPATLTVKPKPSAPIITVTNNCGNSVLAASGYTGTLLWSNGATTSSITVTNVATYTVTQTVNGCTSSARSATSVPKAVPSAPAITVVNNCGNSVLTASGYTGTLLWSNGATTSSIAVTNAAAYTVTQTVNGCTSAVRSATSAPKAIPSAPIITVANNCGNSVLTASDYTGTLLWSNGATTSSITVTNADTYTVTQTVNGCTSTARSATSAPKAIPPAPTVTVTNNCGNSVLTASGYTGTLLWSNGATTASITVTNAATYTVTQTLNGCTSTARSATSAPGTMPSAPTVTVLNNCGNSVLTASGYTGTLLWSNGAATSSITVTNAATYTVTQTVNGCTSAARSVISAPKATPSAPTISANGATTFCQGGSVTLTSSIANGNVWINGSTTQSIIVNSSGSYTLKHIDANGCSSANSNAISVTVNPLPTLSGNLTATVVSGMPFSYTPTSTTPGTTYAWSRVAVSGISNATANGTGNINETLVNTTRSTINVTYVYTLTANGCTSTQNLVVMVEPPPMACSATTSIAANFNGTAIPAGRYIWFNSVFKPTNLGNEPVNFYLSNSKITYTGNNQQIILNVPNSHILIASDVATASTQYINNVWETAVSRSNSGNVFLSGLSYLVPSNLPGGIKNVTWTADIEIDKAGVSIDWKWTAGVYTSFAGNSGLNVKPVDGLLNILNPLLGLANAGTPQNYTLNIVPGAMAAGLLNITSTYSAINSITCNASRNAIVQQSIKILPKQSTGQNLDLTIMPNPASTYFSCIIRSNNESPVIVRVLDIFGQVLEKHEKIVPGAALRLGHALKGGTYFVEVVQGDQRKITKIIKIN